MEKKIEAAPIVRDAEGWYSHPDLPEFDEGDAEKFRAWVAAQQLETQSVWMEHDAPTLSDRYHDGDGDPSAMIDWQPSVPADDGWFLLAIYDAEDGPVAWFGRRTSAAQ